MSFHYEIHFRKALKKNNIFPVSTFIRQSGTAQMRHLLNFVTNITKNYQYTFCPDSLH